MHSTSNFMVVWMTKKHLKEHWFEGRGWVRWLKSWETHKLFIWENWTRNVCIKMHCSSVDLLIFFFVIPSWKTFLVPTFSFFVRDIWDLPNPESGGDRSAFSASGDVQQWATSLQPIWEDASVCGPRDGFLPGVSHMWALCVLLFNTWLWQRKSMCILPPRCSRWSRGGCLGTSHGSWDDWRSKTPFCYRWSPPKIQPRCTTNCKQLLADIHMRGHSFSPTWNMSYISSDDNVSLVFSL